MNGAILVVEDEQAIADLVRAYLRREGFDVVWARSGEQALEELSRHPVRLVVLDIGLPGIDGFEVCRRPRPRRQRLSRGRRPRPRHRPRADRGDGRQRRRREPPGRRRPLHGSAAWLRLFVITLHL